MASSPIERHSVPDQVAKAILDFLRAEGYRPGDKIPSTKTLCDRFGVGYPTLREAIQQLETLGLVRVKHGAGIFVESLKDHLFVLNPMEPKLSAKGLLDLIQARRAIEPVAASLAARHATAGDLDQMREVLHHSGVHLNEDTKLSRSNMEFHRLIAKASGNEVFTQIMTVLTNYFIKEQELIMIIYDAREKDHGEHWAIFEALQARNPDRAARLMAAHLDGVADVLRSRGYREEDRDPSADPGSAVDR